MMKKSLKLVLAIMLIISLAFATTGCGNNKNNDENSKNESSVNTENKTEENGKSKTYNALNKVLSGENYVMTLQGKADMGEGEEDVTMTVAAKGENIYIDVNATSQHATIMYKDGTTYIISHDEKAYIAMKGKDEGTFDEDTTFISKDDLKAIESQECKKGKETIDGTEYEYEEFNTDEGNTTERYYFLNNDLKYVKSIDEDEEELMKIIKLSSEVDESLFNIPTGYETVDMDNLQ